MSGFPILSIMLAVPFVGALWCLFAPGSEEGRAQGARVTALAATLIDFALGLVLWFGYQAGRRPLAVRREVRSVRPLLLGAGDRRHRDAADRAHRVPGAALHPRLVEGDRQARTRIYGDLPAHRAADARRVHGAGPVPVLHHVRGRPHPDVHDHRHLGRCAADLRELQILPLHAARLGADADRDALYGAYRGLDRAFRR